jgi:hypothetical protein
VRDTPSSDVTDIARGWTGEADTDSLRRRARDRSDEDGQIHQSRLRMRAGDSTQPLVAVVVALGYLLLLAWFALIAMRLLGSSRRAPPDAPRVA